MTRQVLKVDGAAGAGGYRTIGEALRSATDGAVIMIGAGRYEERLVIDRVVTLVPEQDRGRTFQACVDRRNGRLRSRGRDR